MKTAWERVQLARATNRPKAQDYIRALFTDFIELHGDRAFGDDPSIVAGIGLFEDTPVTILAQSKGNNFEENLKKNFGMPNPEGYRKALRLAHQANKFHRPIITFVDTPGAYPGKGAEERGQAEAIASCLYEFSDLDVPVLCFVIGEGGSGGALAFSVANRIYMLENAVYSILSPEGFASILWKDESRMKEAAEAMKMTSYDLLEAGFVDAVIPEPDVGIENQFQDVIDAMRKVIRDDIRMENCKEERYKKIRHWGIPEWVE